MILTWASCSSYDLVPRSAAAWLGWYPGGRCGCASPGLNKGDLGYWATEKLFKQIKFIKIWQIFSFKQISLNFIDQLLIYFFEASF